MKNRANIFILLFLSVLTGAILIAAAAFFISRPLKTKGVTDRDSFAGIYVPQNENPGLFFDVNGYIKGDGVYIFLPCTADLSRIVFYSTDENGSCLERFEHDFNSGSINILDVEISALQSPLPSLNINISPASPTLEELEDSEDHSISTRGTLELRDMDGGVITEAVSMRGRGNTSWTEDKKSYQVEFSKPKDLLSMGEACKWVLLANASDHSLLRNEVFLSLARDMGLEYTPALQQTDLFINGEYRGTYSLCSKVEKGKNRVDIGENDYLYRIGVDKDSFSFFLYDDLSKKGSEEYAPIYGELRDSRDPSEIEKAAPFLKTAVEELYDPSSDLSDMDIPSLAKYYWLQEFSKTTDPTLRSVYMYWRCDEKKMYMGPAWDYDRTAGIIEMPFREEDYIWPYGWTAREQDYYKSLFQNPVFTKAVYETYTDCGFEEIFGKAAEELPGRIEHISDSAKMNFIRWDALNQHEDNKVAEVYGDTSYESHLKWLSDWLSMRAGWISEIMNETAGHSGEGASNIS